MAKEAWTRCGRKIAFGSEGKIIWDKHSEEIFRNNPNVCFPGHEKNQKIEWTAFHKGNRGYNTQGAGHWVWNMAWRCEPGEIYLTHGEVAAGERQGKGFVVIEPNVVRWKSSAANKDWGAQNYQCLADRLIASGHRLVQFVPPDGGHMLDGVKQIKTRTFRDAASILKNAAAYVGAEGGMHHAAAAFSIKGVVIFGGFIPPSVTGYDMHTNMAGSDRFCGSFGKCDHCRHAMAAVTVDAVHAAAMEKLSGR